MVSKYLEVFIKKTFKNISEDKQNKIIENSIIEFSLNGYLIRL
jgi:hypothetical protein